MSVKFSIITTCKGRLDHLRETLPRMLEQPDSEVVVVDFSCPQGTAEFVAENHPQARVVKVEGQEHFSNWRARNAGAAAATGEVLIFCDADTFLAPDATRWLADNLPAGAFGFFDRADTARFNTAKLRLGFNQLRGFHVIPAAALRRLGGYDDVMEGYAAGADTELETRLLLFGVKRKKLDPALIERVIEHSNEARLAHHAIPINLSYATGYLYRKAKTALMQIRRRPLLAPQLRKNLYETARKAAAALGKDKDVTALVVNVDSEKIGMPLQLGYREVDFSMTLHLSLKGIDRVDEVPVLADEGTERA